METAAATKIATTILNNLAVISTTIRHLAEMI